MSSKLKIQRLKSLGEKLSMISRRKRAERGPLFESFLSELLQVHGSYVYGPENPETDRVLEFRGQFFKVECRYKSRGTLMAGEIREFIERVRAGPANHIGILVTNGSTPRTASGYLSRATPHQVLIMDRDDISLLLSGEEDFELFLRRKNVSAAGGWLPPPIETDLRLSDRTLYEHYGTPSIIIEGKKIGYVANHTRGPTCLVFTPIWYRASERSYVLEAHLNSCDRISDLEPIFHEFGNTFGATPRAAFTLTQNDWSWHGFGAKSFLDCLKDQRVRYEAVGLQDFHHSETALFIDEVRMGGGRDCLFWLAAQPSTRADSLNHVFCGFMFSELPFAIEGFRHFFKSVNDMPDGYDTWEGDRTRGFRVTRELDVHPLGQIVTSDSSGDPLVGGLIVAGSEVRPRDPGEDENKWVGETLSRSRFWILELQGWHDLGRVPQPRYHMGGIRVVEVPAPGFGGAIINIQARSIFPER